MGELVEKDVTTHIKVLLNNVLVPATKHEKSIAKKLELQRDIRTILARWEADWTVDKVPYDKPKPEDIVIPTEHRTIQENPEDEDELESSDEDELEDSDEGGSDEDEKMEV